MERLVAFHNRMMEDKPEFVPALASLALAPAGRLYGTIGDFRVFLYRRGLLSSYRAGVPVISVGNLAVGGTGKTPAVDYLVKLLRGEKKRVAVVSRGYGARVQGVRVVSAGSGPVLSPAECGDEPFLLARRNPEAVVLVAPKRREGVRLAEERFGAQVILLDDGFQHLAVERDLDIVLLDAQRPFGNGRVFPAGILRENRSALRRAGIFLLTRCPEPLPVDPPGLAGMVLHSRHRLSTTGISLDGREVPLSALAGKRGAAFAGIAHPERFYSDLERGGLTLTARVSFADHVAYGREQIERLADGCGEVDYLITTEKDGVKLDGHRFPVPCYQVPMTLQVIEDAEIKRQVLAVVNRGDSK